MKTCRFVFLFIIMGIMALMSHAADVKTIVNAQISVNGQDISPRYASAVYRNLKVVAYVDGKECGRQEECNVFYTLQQTRIFYFPVTVTTSEANIGKTIVMHLVVTAPGDGSNDSGIWNDSEFAKICDGEYIIQDVVLPSGASGLAVKNGAYGSVEEESVSLVTLDFVPSYPSFPEKISINVGEEKDLLSLINYTPYNGDESFNDKVSIPYNPIIEWDFGNSAEYINVEKNFLTGLAETEMWDAYLGGRYTNFSSFSIWTSVKVIDPDVCKVFASLFVDGEELESYDEYEQYGLSAYVKGQRVAGPVPCQAITPTGAPGFLLKLKNAPKGNIEFRVSKRTPTKVGGDEDIYSTSEYIIQSAKLIDGNTIITTFPFKEGISYGSTENTVKVELVVPNQVEVSPTEVTADVGQSISFTNTFTVSFFSIDGSPASIPSTYVTTWNVGNYVDYFSVKGDLLTVNKYVEKILYVGAWIQNKELEINVEASRIKINVTYPLKSISFVKPEQTVWAGETVNVSYMVTPAEAASYYEVRLEYDKSIFTQSPESNVLIVSDKAKVGTYTIKALAYGQDGKALGVEAELKVTVMRHVESFSLTSSSLTMDRGSTRQLDGLVKEVLPSDASDKRIGWKLSGSGTGLTVKETDGKWYVTANAVGQYTLTAYSVENPQLVQRLSVTVNAVVGGITVTSPVQSVYPGGTIDLGYKVDSSDEVSVEWTSSDAGVVSVSRGSDGKWAASALKPGSATLTVKTVPGAKTATITVTVWSHVESVSLTKQTLTLEKGKKKVLDEYVKVAPDDAHDKSVRWTSSDKTVATVSESNGVWSVTAVGGGECVLKVASVDNSKAGATMSLKVTVSVTGITIEEQYLSQTLWVGDSPLRLTSDMYTITPSDASDVSVTWKSADESVVSVSQAATDASWSATPKKVGRTTLTVTTSSGGKSAEMSVEVRRHVESFSLTSSSLTMDRGSTRQLDGLVKEVLPSDASDKRIGWKLSGSGTGLTVKETDGKWYVTANAVGQYTLTAYSVENPQLVQRLSVTVNAVVGGITVTSPVQSVYPGGTIDLGYKVDSSDEVSVEWTSSDAGVVSVSRGSDGKWAASALKPGSATLTVKTVPGAKTATITVTVWSHVSGLTLTEESLILNKGMTTVVDRYVRFIPEDAHEKSLRWISSNESVASLMENNGYWSVNALSRGEATLTVMSIDNPQATATMLVKVVVPLEGVAAVYPNQIVKVGSTVDLSCTFTPSDASDLSMRWTSSDDAVVAVSIAEDGSTSAIAKGFGTAILTGKTNDGGFTTIIIVEVPYHVTEIKLTTSSISFKPSQTFNPDDYVQAVLPEQASDKSMTWKSSDANIVRLEGQSGAYKATAVNVGEATLTARSNDSPNVTATLKVMVTDNVIPLTGLTFIYPTQTVFDGEMVNVAWIPTPPNANSYSVQLKYDEKIF